MTLTPQLFEHWRSTACVWHWRQTQIEVEQESVQISPWTDIWELDARTLTEPYLAEVRRNILRTPIFSSIQTNHDGVNKVCLDTSGSNSALRWNYLFAEAATDVCAVQKSEHNLRTKIQRKVKNENGSFILTSTFRCCAASRAAGAGYSRTSVQCTASRFDSRMGFKDGCPMQRCIMLYPISQPKNGGDSCQSYLL